MSPSLRSLLVRLSTTVARMLFAASAVAWLAPSTAAAQWSTTYETFYLQAKHNWIFRDNYQAADRLFNAFDYGHAILYEKLWTMPEAPASELEVKEFDYLTTRVLVRPPRVPLEESAIEVRYAQLAAEAKVMFDWSHILHRQIYDVLADERLSQSDKDREIQRLIAYYKTRKDVAFSSKPKSMKLMQEQPYSLAFREKYPKFNGLIWGYHWLQVGLYEPLMVGATAEARQAGVRATVARFWQMLQDPPRSLPYQMPMTAAVAPTFAARYPEAAIIFDNLHSMHDVVSDILANPNVPRDRKRAEIMLAARRFRDDTSYVMPVAAWRTMAVEMGIENMGGPSVNFLPALPTPTVTRGAVMEHDDATGKMTAMKTGSMLDGSHAGMDHSSMPGMAGMAQSSDSARANLGRGGRDTTMAVMDHSRMTVGAKSASPPNVATDPQPMGHAAMGHPMPTASDSASAGMMDLQMQMLHDPVIRRRVLSDAPMRRMLMQSIATMPTEHRAMMLNLIRADSASAMKSGSRRPSSKPPAKSVKPTTAPPKAKQVPTKQDSMAGMDHSTMVMPARKPPVAP